MADMVAYWEY